jgi:antibiotic biosynthesis monooxygenase (ABM) superfamily enzyme
MPETVPSPVTTVVARAVAGGREGEFDQWAQRLTDAAERFPGLLG